ncbi:MAG TPA: ABC transporter permease [Acidimicrobiales bacterium]|nr:ABC transporter permease [Acidimicrobiales bacterium]
MSRRSHIGLVAARELLDYRRQRKVWRRLFLQPFVVMLLLAVPVLVFRAVEARERRATFSVGVEGDVGAVPGLRAALDRPPLDARHAGDAARQVIAGTVDTGVVVPAGAADDVAAGRPVRLQVLTLPSDASSRFGSQALARRLDELRAEVAAQALRRKDVPAEVATPIALRLVDLTTASSAGTRFGLAQALPPLLVIQLFGLMAAAEERIAGAKDRRVLEPLLVLPFRRLDVLLGIGAATMGAGFLAAGLLFVPLVVGLTLALATVTETVAGPLEVAGALLLGIGVFGAMFTAVGLYAGARAHSGGEGSVFVSVAQLAVFAIASVTPFLTDVAGDGPILLVPVLGPMLLVRDAVAGGFAPGPTLLAGAGAALVTVGLVRRAVRLVDAEASVLRAAR